MKLYLLSLGVGVLVGILYSVLNVRSPAPPIVALIGLFGMLLGEQVGPVARRLLAGEPLAAAASLSRARSSSSNIISNEDLP
ncbi:DUF1427 family protein [Sorangium sp. So ce861]|uniref:DUF1427 family protein n=1 Tax=Sorangium sp. So ce861 TaxID=3133323 RepID=UPI003F60ACD4